MRPTMRELTVTKRKPKTTTSSEAARLASPDLAPGTGLNWRKKNMRATMSSDRAADHDAHGQVVFGAEGFGGGAGFSSCCLKPLVSAPTMVGRSRG
jgi:hypothetical protein